MLQHHVYKLVIYKIQNLVFFCLKDAMQNYKNENPTSAILSFLLHIV